MGFDANEALREVKQAEKHLSVDEQLERMLEGFQRGFHPERRLQKRLLEAASNLGSDIGSTSIVERFLEQQRRQSRELATGLMRSTPVESLMEQLKQSIVTISDAPALDVTRQVREMLAAYDVQIAQMSRRILEGMNAPMVGVRLPRLDAFHPPLDPVPAEVPYSPQPEPVVEADVTPVPQPAAPDLARDFIEQHGIDVAKSVISGLILAGIIWRMQTGMWVFEELMAYYIELLNELLK